MALDLIAPLIPNAQENKGPELFLQAMGQGLQAVSRFAQMRRDTEMEVLRLAEHERLAQEQNVLEREKMAQDYDLRQETIAVSRDVNSALGERYRAEAKAYREGTKTGTQRAIKRQEQEQALATEINEHATSLNLDDPNFVTKNPVQFAANVLQFEDSWKQSPLPWVQGAIKRYRTEADRQKITIKTGATYDELAKTWEGGKAEEVPIWQIVREIQDPKKQDATFSALQAAGHTKLIDEFQNITTITNPLVKSALEEGKGVEFKRVPSRVPPSAAPRSAYDTLPEPDLPSSDTMPDGFTEPQASVSPKFEETETDKLIRQAKGAIAKRPDAAMAIAKRLQELGVDPQTLWS